MLYIAGVLYIEIKEQKLDNFIDRVNLIINTMLNDYKVRLDNIKSSYVLKNPLATYEVKKEKLINLEKILNKLVVSKIDVSTHKYEVIINKLELLNPLNILSKGYSLVTLDDEVVKSTKNLKLDDNSILGIFIIYKPSKPLDIVPKKHYTYNNRYQRRIYSVLIDNKLIDRYLAEYLYRADKHTVHKHYIFVTFFNIGSVPKSSINNTSAFKQSAKLNDLPI